MGLRVQYIISRRVKLLVVSKETVLYGVIRLGHKTREFQAKLCSSLVIKDSLALLRLLVVSKAFRQED